MKKAKQKGKALIKLVKRADVPVRILLGIKATDGRVDPKKAMDLVLELNSWYLAIACLDPKVQPAEEFAEMVSLANAVIDKIENLKR